MGTKGPKTAVARAAALSLALGAFIGVGTTKVVSAGEKASIEVSTVRLFHCTVPDAGSNDCVEVCGSANTGSADAGDDMVVDQGCESALVPEDMANAADTLKTRGAKWWKLQRAIP